MTELQTRSDFGDRSFIAGGAGFVGRHFTDHLLADAEDTAVTLYDNFTSGREWHVKDHLNDWRFIGSRSGPGETSAFLRQLNGKGS
jgi:UDP-glucose 4-epimerase